MDTTDESNTYTHMSQETFGRQSRNSGLLLTIRDIRKAQQIRIDPYLGKILADTRTKIRIEIDSDNQPILSLISLDTGTEFGLIQDIEKIAKLQEFVKEEKDIKKKVSLFEPFEKRMFYAVRELRNMYKKEYNTPFEIDQLRASQVVILKNSAQWVLQLERNRVAVEKALQTHDGTARECCWTILRWIFGSLEANMWLLQKILEGTDSTAHLHAELFNQGVPAWAYRRLTKMSLENIKDLRRFIFPQDGAKGLRLSIAELADPKFVEKNSFVLSSSRFQRALILKRGFLKELFKLKEDPNWAVPESLPENMAALLKEELLITPVLFDADYIIAPKAKGKIGTYSHNSAYGTPKAALHSINDGVVAILTLDASTGKQVGMIWDPLMRGLKIDFKSNVSAKRNLFQIAMEAGNEALKRVGLLYHLASSGTRNVFRDLLKAELKIDDKSIIYKNVCAIFSMTPEKDTTSLFTYDTSRTSIDPQVTHFQGKPSRPKYYDAWSKPLDEVQNSKELDEVRGLIGFRKQKAIRDEEQRKHLFPAMINLDPLGVETLDALRKVRSVAPVVGSLESWLRSFSYEAFQLAAIHKMRLVFEEELENPSRFQYDSLDPLRDTVEDDEDDDDVS